MSTISSTSGSSSMMSQFMQQMFKKADTDQNGTISKDEFTQALEDAPRMRSSRGVDAKFTKLDSDGDGQLTEQEVTAGIQKIVAMLQGRDGLAQASYSGGDWDPLAAFREPSEKASN